MKTENFGKIKTLCILIYVNADDENNTRLARFKVKPFTRF